jgi:hypothetical protein
MMSLVITPMAFSGNLVFLTLAPDETPTRANGMPNRSVRIFANSRSPRSPLALLLIFRFVIVFFSQNPFFLSLPT